MKHYWRAAALSLAVSIFLCACSGVEPEKRAYPLIMAVDYWDSRYQVIYGMPDMAAVTGQEKTGGEEPSGGNSMVLSFSGRDSREIREHYNATQEKYLDLGHLQVLVLGTSLLSGDHWKKVLEDFRRNPVLGEDIYLFRTQDIGAVMELNGSLSSSLGEYLVGIYENRPFANSRENVSLRDAYDSLWEEKELPDLPSLILEGSGIRVVFSEGRSSEKKDCD